MIKGYIVVVLFALLYCATIFSMEDNPPSIVVIAPSPFENRSSSGEASSNDDDLCDAAMAHCQMSCADFSHYIRPHIKSMLHEVDDSPVAQRMESHAQFIERIRSEDSQDVENDRRMNELITRAIHKAFLEKEEQIKQQQARIHEKYSGKKVALIGTAIGAISTAITTICATLITLNSK
jgi:hypothetical protein